MVGVQTSVFHVVTSCSGLLRARTWIRERSAAEERSWVEQALFYQSPGTERLVCE